MYLYQSVVITIERDITINTYIYIQYREVFLLYSVQYVFQNHIQRSTQYKMNENQRKDNYSKKHSYFSKIVDELQRSCDVVSKEWIKLLTTKHR